MRFKGIFLCLILLIPASAAAQKDEKERLRQALDRFFSSYQVPGYHPHDAMRIDSFRADDRERSLELYANEPFSSQPFTSDGIDALRERLLLSLPQPYNAYRLTILDGKGQNIYELIPNIFRKSDEDRSRLWGSLSYNGNPWVRNVSLPYAVSRGLSGRHLFIWPSHGRYYKNEKQQWVWQRPNLYCTTEDLFTQSIVVPYLLPMLEKAGAVVYTPRERDVQDREAIVDNDRPERGGRYVETVYPEYAWTTSADTAFASPTPPLVDGENPFRLGTAREIAVTTRRTRLSTASWEPDLPHAGRYAVYVSYVSRPNSVSDAHYIVYHKGGRTLFHVNQQMGGGTWVYLGTFEFDAGRPRENRVVLTNQSDYRGVVTADAVRFGGGRGLVSREAAGTSGMPRFLESARYQAQWCGMPLQVYYTTEGNDDYVDDIRARSYMCNYMSGGSVYRPGQPGLGVPFELSLALHSDAGFHRDRRVYGTLGICTTADSRGFFHFSSGLSRKASRDLIGILLSSVTADLSQTFGLRWPRRELWDRNYGESRTPDVPSAIVEMLSHQSFADLRYGHDPWFKFTLARSLYKGILRFVAHSHGQSESVVQPLPVGRFAARLEASGDTVSLSWQPTPDPLDSTARATAYVVYTKEDDGPFDNGRLVTGRTSLRLPVVRGTRYAFRVTAVNDGGESFPSETLSVFSAPSPVAHLLVVNGFTRLSGPATVETADSLGFDLAADPGVPYMYTAAFCGPQVNFAPSAPGTGDPDGLGYSTTEWEGRLLAGNTFNYPEAHGRAIAAAGRYSYSSCSRAAFCDEAFSLAPYAAIDYIAGLQRDVPYNLRPAPLFDAPVRRRLESFSRDGGSLLVSGAYVGAALHSREERDFADKVLKYCYDGAADADVAEQMTGLGLQIPVYLHPNADHYAAVRPDAIRPTDKAAFPAFAFSNGQPAGVAWHDGRRGVLVMSFPFECIRSGRMQARSMEALLRFLLER